MHTLNQAEHNDYDIDVAVVFEKGDLPEDPLKARQRVRDALLKRCDNFTKEPEARHNAVTVWYQDGYNIDFAVYRTWRLHLRSLHRACQLYVKRTRTNAGYGMV